MGVNDLKWLRNQRNLSRLPVSSNISIASCNCPILVQQFCIANQASLKEPNYGLIDANSKRNIFCVEFFFCNIVNSAAAQISFKEPTSCCKLRCKNTHTFKSSFGKASVSYGAYFFGCNCALSNPNKEGNSFLTCNFDFFGKASYIFQKPHL